MCCRNFAAASLQYSTYDCEYPFNARQLVSCSAAAASFVSFLISSSSFATFAMQLNRGGNSEECQVDWNAVLVPSPASCTFLPAAQTGGRKHPVRYVSQVWTPIVHYRRSMFFIV